MTGVLLCSRSDCGFEAALTGDWHADGGTLIQHMQDAHTPHAVPVDTYHATLTHAPHNGRYREWKGTAASWDDACEAAEDANPGWQVHTCGIVRDGAIGWIPATVHAPPTDY